MFSWDKINIRFKILIPTVLLIAFAAIAVYILLDISFEQRMLNEIEGKVANRVNTLNWNMSQLSNEALELGLAASSQVGVIDAFEAYSADSDEENAYIQLKTSIDNYLLFREQFENADIRITCYGTDGMVLYRNFTEVKFDLVTQQTKTAFEVLETGKAVKGLEVTKSGVDFHGSVPIFTPMSDVPIGVVDVCVGIGEILNSLDNEANEEFAFFLHENYFDLLNNRMINKEQKPLFVGQYIYFIHSSGNFEIDNIKQQNLIFESETDSIGNSFTVGNYVYTAVSWFDISGARIGIGVFQMDVGALFEDFKLSSRLFILAGVLFLIFVAVVMYFVAGVIVKPIRSLSKDLRRLAVGNLAQLNTIKADSEIREMAESLEQLRSGLYTKAKFADAITSGNFEYEYRPQSRKDTLGIALLGMRESLLKAQEVDNVRKEQDAIQKWISEGRAMFADIMRNESNDSAKLLNLFINNVVNYLNANQGGIFLLIEDADEVPYLELSASYAYNRQRFIQKRIEVGDGIIGTCAIEKETLYLRKVPDDYVEIRSGLGTSNPKTLLLVPMKLENEVFGVIELASFNEFKNEQIEFVEIIAESLSTTLLNIKMNKKTKEYLRVSEQQAEKLRLQEDMLLRRMEEMQMKQEITERRETEATNLLESISKIRIKAEFSLDGNLITANSLFIDTFEYSSIEIEQRHYSMFLRDSDLATWEQHWRTVLDGKPIDTEVLFITKSDKRWLKIALTPVYDNRNEIEKVQFIAADIDRLKTTITEQSELLAAIKKVVVYISFDTKGVITEGLQYLNIPKEKQNKEYSIFNLISEESAAVLSKKWTGILNGEVFKSVDVFNTSQGTMNWFKGEYRAISLNDKVEKVVYVGIEVSDIVDFSVTPDLQWYLNLYNNK